jgi:hypothetical protein
VQRLRLILCLAIFPAALAFLGGSTAHDAKANVTVGMSAGALVGAFFGLVFGGVRAKWLDKVFGPEGDEEESPTAPVYPPSDESFNRLHAAGWSVGDVRVLTQTGHLWRVSGANGENAIDATGETQAEAWFRAAEQARTLGFLGFTHHYRFGSSVAVGRSSS